MRGKIRRTMSMTYNMITMYLKTIGDTNALVVFVSFIIPFLVTLFELLFWGAITENGVYYMGIRSSDLVKYILLANLFQQQFNVYTPATAALWEGSIIRYYTRPVSIIQQLVYEMIGKLWIPKWLMFSIPTVLIIAICGFEFLPYDFIHFIFFLISMLMAIIIGFEIDIAFSSIAIRLKNGCWAAVQIRNAIIIVLSVQLVPFQVLPDKLAGFLMLLPFASIANAPLSIYVGGDYTVRILLQCFWAIVLGFVSYIMFTKAEEEMVSFGG